MAPLSLHLYVSPLFVALHFVSWPFYVSLSCVLSPPHCDGKRPSSSFPLCWQNEMATIWKKKYAYSHKVIHNKGNSNGTSEEQKPFRIHSWPNDSTCWEEFLYILYILIHELHALIFFLFLFEWNWMFSVCQGSPFLCFVCIIKPWSKKKKSYIIDRIYKGLLAGVSVCTWHCQINVWFSSRR